MHWYLLLESTNPDNGEEVQAYYQNILDDLLDELENHSRNVYDSLMSAIELRQRLLNLSAYIKE